MEKIRKVITKIEIIKELCGKPCDLCAMYNKKCMPEIMATKLVEKGFQKKQTTAKEIIDLANELIQTIENEQSMGTIEKALYKGSIRVLQTKIMERYGV